MNEDAGAYRIGRWWGAAFVAALVIVAAGGTWYALVFRGGPSGADAAMQARASAIMPFDLNHTKHTFTKTDSGGIEQVIVNDPGDATNLALIRSHLAKEAELFRSGNYSDPAKIHGMDMPGLKELEAGAKRVTVVYADLPGGAQITYSSTELALVSALHSWFDRQIGDHSMPGMGGN
jgi:hypothetical protein